MKGFIWEEVIVYIFMKFSAGLLHLKPPDGTEPGQNRGKLSGGKVYRRGDSTQTCREATEVKHAGCLNYPGFYCSSKRSIW